MYFPYLRGRQFELIGLRELVNQSLISDEIIPIIEPVKFSSTFIKTLEVFSEKEHPIGVILNPKIGNFLAEFEDDSNNRNRLLNLLENENLIKSFLVNRNLKEEFLTTIEDDNFILINKNKDDFKYYIDFKKTFTKPKYMFIPDDRIIKRRLNTNTILLNDNFNKLARNADYDEFKDELFSCDHLYYSTEGYKGFSDYSIVGDSFSKSGFAPYAVTLHIVYFAKNDFEELELRVHHFVSDSNNDITNPAGKFNEALCKLMEWIEEQTLSNNYFKITQGLKQFISCYENQNYPGLGTVKKMSIMHHIELINMYLRGDISDENM